MLWMLHVHCKLCKGTICTLQGFCQLSRNLKRSFQWYFPAFATGNSNFGICGKAFPNKATLVSENQGKSQWVQSGGNCLGEICMSAMHKACFDLGIAPKLLGVNDIGYGWKLVIMEYLKDTKTLADFPHQSQAFFNMIV